MQWSVSFDFFGLNLQQGLFSTDHVVLHVHVTFSLVNWEELFGKLVENIVSFVHQNV